MIHQIGYNSQRNNFNFAGKFPGWTQCFSTSAWMFMSFYSPDIKAADDSSLAVYVDDVEETVGKPGIAEKAKRKFNWITGKTSLWWLIQKDGIESWLWRHGVKGQVVFRDSDFPFGVLPTIIDHGPVILGTTKMGGLSGGHIILAVGYDDNNIICHDPYGNAQTNYKDEKGAFVKYPHDFLRKYTGEKIRCMYWKPII